MGKTTLILGVTGNIASGKSQVAELLRQRGASVLSADQLAREVVAPGTRLLKALASEFGEKIIREDASLDRELLGRLVFADEARRQRLNALLHPAIARLAEEHLATLVASGPPLVVYEAPLLFEAGAESRVDKVLVVTISSVLQVERLMARDHCSLLEAQRRIAAQMPQQQKVARADYLIDNSGSFTELEQAVADLWQRLVKD